MSSIVNKIKDAVHSDKDKTSDPAGSHGPHDSRTGNVADPRVDSDRDHRGAPATGTYGANTNTGAGIGGDNFTASGTGVTGAPGGTSHTGTYGSSNRGPHDSNIANKADPRIDSDRDHRAAPGAGMTSGTTGYGSTGAGEFGSSRTAGTGIGSTGTGGLGSTNRGPHDSNIANKADPRIDSDRDGRAAPGAGMTSGTTGYGSTGAGEFGSSRTAGTGIGSTGGEFGSSRTAGTGIGSTGGEFGSSRTTGTAGEFGSSTTGTTGGYNTRSTGTAGEYGSSTAGAGIGAMSGNPGPAPNTAGPHKQDMLNKVDPRVDSDRDGSKTLGQDQTFSRP